MYIYIYIYIITKETKPRIPKRGNEEEDLQVDLRIPEPPEARDVHLVY